MSTVRVYEIQIGNVGLSPDHLHVLAQDFGEAFEKAQKIIEDYKKNCWETAEILEISFECDVDS